MQISRKYIVDEKGNPREVILPLEDFRKIEELLGLDLEDEVIEQLQRARRDRETDKEKSYVHLDSMG